MWHIVYLSYESTPGGRQYIGKHSTDRLDDGYFGSFSTKNFNPDSKVILGYFKTAQAAVSAEIQWQQVFKVVQDPTYANQAYQTSSGWDTTGRIRPESERETIRKSKTGENHPLYGKKRPKHSQWMKENSPSKRPEVKNKISQTMTGDHHHNKTPEMRQKISQVMTGYRWWTNGLTNTRAKESPGDEWTLGMTLKN